MRGRVGPLLLVGNNNKTTAALVKPLSAGPFSGCPRRDIPRPPKHRVTGRPHPPIPGSGRPQWWAVARRHRGGWSRLEHVVPSWQRPTRWTEANFFRKALHRSVGGARVLQHVLKFLQPVRAAWQDRGGGERHLHKVLSSTKFSCLFFENCPGFVYFNVWKVESSKVLA